MDLTSCQTAACSTLAGMYSPYWSLLHSLHNTWRGTELPNLASATASFSEAYNKRLAELGLGCVQGGLEGGC